MLVVSIVPLAPRNGPIPVEQTSHPNRGVGFGPDPVVEVRASTPLPTYGNHTTPGEGPPALTDTNARPRASLTASNAHCVSKSRRVSMVAPFGTVTRGAA